ncbi:PorT family protein [bacterium]|nr:PorT family protein [bacterium]
MKKTLLFALCFIGTISLKAQVETSIGFKGGPAFNTFSGSELETATWGTGITAGGFINLGLADVAQFQFELLYDRLPGTYGIDSGAFKSTVSYFSTPLLFKLRFPFNEKAIPYVSIGQSVGYKLGENTYRNGVNDDGTSVDQDHFINYNLASLFGIGVDFETDLVFFNVDLRYIRGNINVSTQDYNMRTNAIGLTAGLGFKLVKNGSSK